MNSISTFKDKNLSENTKRQYSIREIADQYGISEWSLRKLIREKKCPHRRIGRRIYIPVKQFQEWLSAHDVETVDDKKITKEGE